MVVIRGDIFWADYGEPVGSEPGNRRPVLIVQSDLYNRSRIGTVIAVPLTSNLSGQRLPGCILLAAAETGLSKASVANATQVGALDKARLESFVGHLDYAVMAAVDSILHNVLGI
jgi:mRNA interferase MazF